MTDPVRASRTRMISELLHNIIRNGTIHSVRTIDDDKDCAGNPMTRIEIHTTVQYENPPVKVTKRVLLDVDVADVTFGTER